MIPYGYHGNYLHIDLSRTVAQRVAWADGVLRKFLGGSGLGTHLLLEQGAARLAPLSPQAPLCFVFSPLVGSPLTTSAKFAVVSKSPLTGRINDSLASSGFAIAGKKTGSDALVIQGRAAEPSILLIEDGQITLQPAADLWGMTIPAAELALRERLGSQFQFAVIGPAGERCVHYATISHDGRHAGRGGSGAVMGAKNLKAIAVRGSHRASWAQLEALTNYARELSRRSFGPATAKYRELGTASNLLLFNRLHALPTRNFQQGSFAGAEAISPESLSLARKKTRASCAACTIGCEHIYALADKNSDKGKSVGVRLEYENLFALGSLCGVDQADHVLRAMRRCDELGLDTISAGGTIAFAMECAERRLLDAPWLQFGDGEAVLQALDHIVTGGPLGEQLALGSRQLALRLGGDAISFAPQVKGLELPGYEPRALQTMALGFAVGSRGADHNRSGAYEADFSTGVDRRNPDAGAVQKAIESEDKAAIMDSLILCKFLRGVFDDFFSEAAAMLNLVTGWDTTAEELQQAAKQIVNAKKQFNIQAGWTPEEDRLPERFLTAALPEDAAARLPAERLQSLIEIYNPNRGWNRDGWPPDRATQAIRSEAIRRQGEIGS